MFRSHRCAPRGSFPSRRLKLSRQGSHSARVALLLLWTGSMLACAAAVPVAGDVAGTAIDKGSDVVNAGKAQTHQPVAIDDMIAITRRAAGELDLRQMREERHPDQIKIIYQDQRNQDITVTLVRRTYKATEIKIDVGLFGDAGMGQLMLRQMLHDLPPAAAEVDAARRKAAPITDATSPGDVAAPTASADDGK